MIHLAICEDELQTMSLIKSYIENLFSSRGLAFLIDEFLSGEGLFESQKDIHKYEIVFLDVNMSGMSGVDVARKLRNQGFSANIVFVSGVIEAAPEGYEVNAYRYIVKDEHFEEHFESCINNIIDIYIAPQELFVFNNIAGKHSILINEIAFFESQLRKIVVHFIQTGTRNYLTHSFYARIADIEVQLERYDFIRIHKGYVVNPAHIEKLSGRSLFMDDGTNLPVSSARHSEVKRQYLKWKAGYGSSHVV